MTKQATVKSEKLTKAQIAAAAIEAQKQEVQRLLGWDDLKYASFKEEMGKLYMEYKGYGDWWDEVSRCGKYWQWWKNQWNIREKQFLKEVFVITGGTQWMMEDMYIGRNNPYYLTGLHLNIDHEWMRWINKEMRDAELLDETYAEMMQEFIDHTMKQPC